jgi:hypothetical protein
MKIIDNEGKKFIQYKIGSKSDMGSSDIDGLSSSDKERYIVEVEVEFAEKETFEILKDEAEIPDLISFDESLGSIVFNFPNEPIDLVRIIQDLQDMDPSEFIYLYKTDESWNKGEEILPRYMLDDEEGDLFEDDDEDEK